VGEVVPPIPPAIFDAKNHAVTAGWATYHQRPRRRGWRLRCFIGRHLYPHHVPQPANGHSPSNYAALPCCGAWAHWYVEGQHRYGGVSRG
jgi:hypothetical protein